MSLQNFREHSKWLSQISAAVSLIIVVFIRSKFIFESGNTAGTLLLIATITSLLTLIFGVASLPRWQGFIALAIFALVAYFILFEPLYGIP
jgi:hypothetical protein